uniref:Uncharacterized protein n=1 Tax=Rhizophora mucronata TaxID=61149 RepID=A0A2P2QCA2_RHIMU
MEKIFIVGLQATIINAQNLSTQSISLTNVDSYESAYLLYGQAPFHL